MTVAIASVGVPLPAPTVNKSAEPFPCQHSLCGCKDAETCWRHCCCHTNRQKLAWARKHGVTPPAFVVAAARRESFGDEKATASCCSARLAHHKTDAPRREPCCGGRRAAPDDVAAAPHPEAKESSTIQVVTLAAKLRCGGVSLSVSLLPPSLIAPPVAIALDIHVQYAAIVMEPNLYEPPFLSIAAPPPRRMA